mgnify:CR=1 FL=1
MQISSRTLLLMALAMPAILPSSGFSQPKPVPDRAAQQAAAARIKSLFADEYAAEDRAVRAKFAQQLLELARSEKDDVNRFTLYREAVRMASEAGDAQTALSATDLMSEHFAIKPTSVKVYALSNVSKQTLPPEAAIAAADACMSLVPDCIAENEFTQAQRLIEYGQNALRRVRDNQRIAALRKLGESVADIEKQYRTVGQHAAKLKANPDDGDANLAVGKFECFAKGNWQVGLKHLSSGSDAMLRKLAAETLSNPGDAQSQFSVANGWWKQADKLGSWKSG